MSSLDTAREREADEARKAAVDEEQEVSRVQTLLGDRRKLATGALAIVLAVVAIYVLFPQVVGLEGSLDRIDSAKWYWVVGAVAATVLGFGAYVMLFQGVIAGQDETVSRRIDMKASLHINLAGLAATRIFSAGGAGGIALTYWALRRAGMERARSACRMIAFLALMYSIYLFALVIFGVLLRTGVFPGDNPAGGTIVPAAIAGAVIVVLALVALIPADIERRIRKLSEHPRVARVGSRLAAGPATVARGIRTAIAYARHPSQGATALVGAVGFWAMQITTLWFSFKAFGESVPIAVLVQGFFVGMAANLIPSPAGGAGPVDAGMIAAFALFGIDSAAVFPAVLTYRIIAFWLPIPPGIAAFFALRRTVHEWEREDAQPGYTSQSKVKAEAT